MSTEESENRAGKRGAMKRVVVITAVFTLLTLLYLVPDRAKADAGPHGSYAVTTATCATCHRTHTAPSARLINNTSTENAFCYTCHNGTGASATPVVSTHANTAFTANSEAPFALACTQCHDPHGNANTLYSIKTYVQVQAGASPILAGAVQFTASTGINSYDDGVSTTASRLCLTCHDNINNPGYPMSNHAGGANHLSGDDYTGQDCTTCHPHSVDADINTQDGFMLSCTACHSQPPDGSNAPNRAGSHATHFAPTPFGPQLTVGTCDDCHAYSAATHNDGQVTFIDGQPLATTTACDACHSPGGTYDGVNDAVYGAKANWMTGVYTGAALTAGKEQWCAGCHDEMPANSLADNSGINAVNVIGDESGSYTYDAYGTGWGYYKTGHGLDGAASYPASGGVTNGAGLGCGDCHDLTSSHIDGVARTFDDGNNQDTDPSLYRAGYRLKLVNGQEPMQVPWTTSWPSPPNDATRFELCYSCHDATPFIDAANGNTNLKTDGLNRHESHLRINQLRYSSDWDGVYNSRITCSSCHNVHGSTRLAMVRDGRLINSQPGLQIWYNNDDIVTYNTSNADPPDPEDLQLAASTGTIWIGRSSDNLCSHCHANGNTKPEYRLPFQNVAQAPTLAWTGENSYTSDGVYPDVASAGTAFEFRILYTDGNNDAPSPIEVWVDSNDNGVYESGEKYGMTTAVFADRNRTDGSIYTASVPLSTAGDNTFNYRFYAADGVLVAAQSMDGTVTVINNPPTVDWTAEPYYENDGVHPDSGASGSPFTFKILYTDVDGDAPAVMEVWIDANENSSYEGGERHTMTAVSGSYETGMVYAYTAVLSPAVDGTMDYTFRANDGSDNAVTAAAPLSNNIVTVNMTANNPPMLDYDTAACSSNGVKPARGLATGDFEFSVIYTDLDNQCPSATGYVQLWIDENDNAVADAGETYPMIAAAGNCTSGKRYTASVPLAYSGDGVLAYQFSASDGIDVATGAAAGGGDQVTVVSTATAVGVRTGTTDFGPIWYNNVQTAVDAVSFRNIMVYEGAYTQSLTISGAPDDGLTLESVCGADMTSIHPSVPSDDVLFIQLTSSSTIDGFTITGGANGVYIRNTSGVVTIANSIIRNNNRGILSGNGSDRLAITDSVIRDNSGIDYGAGVYYSGRGPHSISNSIIENNTATINGGGLFIQNVAAGQLMVTAVDINNNSASTSGGGVYMNNSSPTFSDSSIFANSAGSNGGGVYANGSFPLFSKVSINANSANGSGGGIFANSSGILTLENSNVTANSGNAYGGGLYLNTSATANIMNSTFARNSLTNTTTGLGGGIYGNAATASIVNSIFWNNTASGNGSGHGYYARSGTVTFSYSNMINNSSVLAGSGVYTIDAACLATDPLFIGGTPYNYHLKSISPNINAATNAGAPADDIDYDARPQGGGWDIGSDEATN